MIQRRLHPRSIIPLLALAFIAIQAIALAHQLKHDLRQHDDASCVLHLQSKSAGAKPIVDLLLAPVFIDAGPAPGAGAAPDSPSHPGAYHSRAPPSILR